MSTSTAPRPWPWPTPSCRRPRACLAAPASAARTAATVPPCPVPERSRIPSRPSRCWSSCAPTAARRCSRARSTAPASGWSGTRTAIVAQVDPSQLTLAVRPARRRLSPGPCSTGRGSSRLPARDQRRAGPRSRPRRRRQPARPRRPAHPRQALQQDRRRPAARRHGAQARGQRAGARLAEAGRAARRQTHPQARRLARHPARRTRAGTWETPLDIIGAPELVGWPTLTADCLPAPLYRYVMAEAARLNVDPCPLAGARHRRVLDLDLRQLHRQAEAARPLHATGPRLGVRGQERRRPRHRDAQFGRLAAQGAQRRAAQGMGGGARRMGSTAGDEEGQDRPGADSTSGS